MKQRVLLFINKNLKKCLIISILISALDVIAFVIATGHSIAICVSSFSGYMTAIYAISNISGAEFGRKFNMHIFRWHYLKKHNKKDTYKTNCLKYVAVLFPVTVLWSITNIILAIITKAI